LILHEKSRGEKMKKFILIGFLFLIFSTGVVSAADLSNSGGGEWKYYREITIKENLGKTLTDYQVLIELNSAKTPTPTYVNLIQLTSNPENEVCPDWSPDGSKIVYHKVEGNANNIYIMNADGSNQHALTHSSGYDRNRAPKWSSDGSKIAFWAYRPWGEGGSIWTMNADGSNQKKIYHQYGYDQYCPAFSPDGGKIVFNNHKRYTEHTDHDIWIMNSDGTNAHIILDDDWQSAGCSFSPDGKWIAFTRKKGEICEIWAMRPDGSELRKIVGSEYNPYCSPKATQIDWSPDGAKLAFVSTKAGNYDIWILTNVRDVINGEKPIYEQITTDSSKDIEPAWSPSGDKIAFVSDKSGNWDIWVASIETPTQPMKGLKPILSLNIDIDTLLKQGEIRKGILTVKNEGNADAKFVKVKLSSESLGINVEKSYVKIPAGEAREFVFEVNANDAGTFKLSAYAEYWDDEGNKYVETSEEYIHVEAIGDVTEKKSITPGFEAIFAIIGLILVTYTYLRRKKR